MPRLMLVGDGERDAAVLPPLVRALVGRDFTPETRTWDRLNRAESRAGGAVVRGFGRKLLFALRSARADGLDGVVAVVDADRSPNHQRLADLQAARDADRRTHPPLAAALSEADPHNEAWLLDDHVAVREGLRLPRDFEIPGPTRERTPKAILQDLHRQSPRAGERPLEVWPDIAERVQLQRCNGRARNGLQAFADEVRVEICPLFDTAA